MNEALENFRALPDFRKWLAYAWSAHEDMKKYCPGFDDYAEFVQARLGGTVRPEAHLVRTFGMFLYHVAVLYAGTPCELPDELLEAIAILRGFQVASYSLKTGQALLDARAQAVVHAATNEQWRQVAEIFCVLNQDPVTYAYLEKKCEEKGLLSNGKCFSSDPATAAKILYDTLSRHLCSWKGGPGSVAAAWISDAACNAAILALTLAQWQCSSSPHDNGDGAR